jgi:Predicted multitransmembrane protein
MLIALGILLLVLMLAIGGERGGRSFAALIENIIILILCIYLISLGINAIVITFVCCAIFTSITLIQQNGASIKTYASAFSVIIVICILSILAGIISANAKIAGYSELDLSEEISRYLSVNIHISMRDLVFAVIIFGLLGAIMDTAIAIASAITEFYNNNDSLSFKDLAHSGKAVGRDILGTTVNTIFFAGIGETMMQTMLFLQYGYTFETLVNSKAFCMELSMILISNIGCFLIIPTVTFITSTLLTSNHIYAEKIREYIQQQSKD